MLNFVLTGILMILGISMTLFPHLWTEPVNSFKDFKKNKEYDLITLLARFGGCICILFCLGYLYIKLVMKL